MVRRRPSTRGRISAAPPPWLAGVAVAPRRETREPCLEPLDVVAQPVDVPQELLDLEAHRHVASFLLQVLRGTGRQRIGCAPTQVEHTAREVRDPACCNVTQDLCQLFLEVRARMIEELAKRLRDFRVALDSNLTASQATLGFRPRESVVLIGLGGVRGNQVGLTVRGDLPPPGSGPALARALSRSVGTGAGTGPRVPVAK